MNDDLANINIYTVSIATIQFEIDYNVEPDRYNYVFSTTLFII